MSFDSSRFTFNPWNDFLGVVMQQGRVQLDSDWNEWLAEFARCVQAGSMDTMGRAVVPATTPNAFLIKAAVDAGGHQHLTIGAGRMYVDGLMVENHGPATSALWDPALAEMSAAPAAPPPVAEIDLDYTVQPYLLNAVLPTTAGPFLVYLDVWKRAVTYLQHPELIDSAVGVDTTGRLQMVWQVKLLDVSNIAGVSCATPDGSIPQWVSLTQPSGAQLTTNVVPSATSGPCCLNTATGYTGMENQLYRVEIHQGGTANSSGTSSPVSATFKWSRDNASVITAVTAINPATNVASNPTSQLTVQSTGRDNVLSFKPGDWIEITDDFLELNGQAGELHQIDSNGVNKALKTIRLQTPVSSDFQTRLISGFDYHTRICRWDQNGKVYQSYGATVWVDLGAAGSTGQIPVPPAGTSLILESGVTVTFSLNASEGNFHVGDFWNFAARASDGTVEILTQAPPRGIHHHYARLSVVTFPTTATDCRTIWPPTVTAGADCSCTVCVDAADHNSGAATIAMAVEKIRSLGGGRICLGPGLFLLGSTLQLEGIEWVTLSGQGPATTVVFAGNGAAIQAQSDVGLRIEDLNVIAIAAQASDSGTVLTNSTAIGILIRNCIDTSVERCGVVALSAPGGSPTAPGISVTCSTSTDQPAGQGFAPAATTGATTLPSVATMAVALDGFLVETQIRDSFLSADIGLGQASLFASYEKRDVMVLADLRVVGNFLSCTFAGAALLGLGARFQQQLNLFLLEIAFRGNRVLGCSLVGVGIEGVTMPDGAIRVANNHIDVSGIGIGCGADGAEIADNLVTQAMSSTGGGAAGTSVAPARAAVAIVSVPGGKLPITQVRILRNRINNYGGPGISVKGLVLITSIVGNSIIFVTNMGISVTGPEVPSEVIVRDNEVFNVVPPAPAAGSGISYGPQTTGANLGQEASLSSASVQIQSAPVTGIQVSTTTTAVIENNSIALIGNSPVGTSGATGIAAANAVAATITGNDISNIGPLTTGGNGPICGISLFSDTVGTVNASSNVIWQTTSGSKQHMPFMGIVIGPNIEPSSPDGFTGEAVVNGNMVFGNDAYLINTLVRHCVLNGNVCELVAELPADPSAAAVAAFGFTCIASNNRIVSSGRLTGLSISVAGDRDLAKATVLGNIVSTSIELNGNALMQPWAPLNVIA